MPVFSRHFWILIAILASTLIVPPARAAVPLENGSESTNTSRARTKMASDAYEFRSTRRVGIGLVGAGPLGLAGAMLELNFAADVGILTGFGGGPGYQSFTFQVKKALGSGSLMPYIAGGFSRWYNFGVSGRPISDTTPGFLAGKFLNERQKREGRIAENLIYPALGLQFLELDGPRAGGSFFAELVLLMDVDDFLMAPTGTLGYMFYF